MPLPLYLEWMAYSRLDPFGEGRADLRAAMLASTMVNLRRTKTQPAVKMSDFMLRFGSSAAEDSRPKSPRDAYQQLKMFLALGPGLVDKRKRPTRGGNVVSSR